MLRQIRDGYAAARHTGMALGTTGPVTGSCNGRDCQPPCPVEGLLYIEIRIAVAGIREQQLHGYPVSQID